MTFVYNTRVKKRLADTDTPISIYLKIRDQFPESILLESSDHKGREHNYSYICFHPIAGITIDGKQIKKKYPDGNISITEIITDTNVVQQITDYTSEFLVNATGHNFSINGLFGYISYDAVQYFETVVLTADSLQPKKIPDVKLNFYRYVLVFDHFKNETFIFLPTI